MLTPQRPCDAWRVGNEFRHQKLALARKLPAADEIRLSPLARWVLGVDGSLALIQGLVMFVAPGRILLAVASAALSCVKLLLQVEMIMVTLILVAAFPVVPEFDPHKRLTWWLGGGFLAILASSVYLSVVMTKRARRCTAPHQPAQAENAGLLQKEGDRVILSERSRQ